MKLLLDRSLSPWLCDRLRAVWTEVVHVRAVGLSVADDSAVLGVYPIALEAWTLVIMREGRAMGGRREWFKVQAALDEREWDFRTVDAPCDPYYPRNAAAPAQAPGGGN